MINGQTTNNYILLHKRNQFHNKSPNIKNQKAQYYFTCSVHLQTNQKDN